MHKFLAAAALASALCFGAPAHAQQAAPATQQESLGVTINAFVALKPGMSSADLVRIIGRPGQETSRIEAMGTATVSYRWSDDGMRSILATLQNDKLVSATQMALQTNVRGESATLARFNQLRPGMTFAEVTQVMGPAGIPVTFTSLMGSVTYSISWAGATPGSTAVVTFQGDRLFSTLQAGLQ